MLQFELGFRIAPSLNVSLMDNVESSDAKGLRGVLGSVRQSTKGFTGPFLRNPSLTNSSSLQSVSCAVEPCDSVLARPALADRPSQISPVFLETRSVIIFCQGRGWSCLCCTRPELGQELSGYKDDFPVSGCSLFLPTSF